MTLLAVAKGRFPISIRGDSDSEPLVIGGPGGYWAMMKAICDDDPPVAGPKFSEIFNHFIDCCLKKDPSARLSAKLLLDSRFVAENRNPDSNELSYESTAEGEADYEKQVLKLTGSIIEKSFSGTTNENRLSSSMNIIYSIRLEHLDRVLGKLVSNVQEKKQFSRAMSDHRMKEDSRSGGIITPEELLSPLPIRRAHQNKPFTVDEKDDSDENNRSNNRSVHFDNDALSDPPKTKRKNLPTLNIVEINGDEVEIDEDRHKSDFDGLALPKTSSYFSATKCSQKEEVKSTYPSTPHGPVKVDYKNMIPRFDVTGLRKWKHLASQLNLPLPIVLMAVRSRLGNIIDLDESI